MVSFRVLFVALILAVLFVASLPQEASACHGRGLFGIRGRVQARQARRDAGYYGVFALRR